MGLQGKNIAEYVTKHQTLDREERAAWGDTQKMQAQEDVELGNIQADTEEKRITVEIRMAGIQAEENRKRGHMRSRWPRLK